MKPFARNMKQLYKLGQTVEVFLVDDMQWVAGTVRAALRCAYVPSGERFYRYKVEYSAETSGIGGRLPVMEVFDQNDVRLPGRPKHSPRVLRANKVKGKI